VCDTLRVYSRSSISLHRLQLHYYVQALALIYFFRFSQWVKAVGITDLDASNPLRYSAREHEIVQRVLRQSIRLVQTVQREGQQKREKNLPESEFIDRVKKMYERMDQTVKNEECMLEKTK
jgi:hypothetical protein